LAGFDLNLLAPLDALLETRSITAAAHRIGVGQPTMSGMLARLREQLHDPLLVRVGRHMELTPRAAEMAPEVRQTLLRVTQLVTPVTAFDPATLRRSFRIMASEFGLFLVLPEVFRRAGTLAPEARFEAVLIDQPAASVYDGSVDLCLTGDILGQVSGDMATVVRTQKLMEDRFVGIVDAAHPLAGAVTLDQLLAYPHVATQFPGSPWTVEDIGLSGLSDRHPPRVRVASFLALGRLVAGTQAVGVIPGGIAALIAGDPALRTIALPAEFGRIAIRLLWHARHDQDPAHRWLRSLVAEACTALAVSLAASRPR
jgi:LysR family transcriptional regulator, nod-box dependent transcriptional activator